MMRTLPTLVIYGSEDNGLDMEKVKLADEVVRLEGGNHAYFGNYGEQAGRRRSHYRARYAAGIDGGQYIKIYKRRLIYNYFCNRERSDKYSDTSLSVCCFT